MEPEFLNIIEKGSFKEFINFFINNYVNNYVNTNIGVNESIIQIAIRNNNFNLVHSLISNGYILNNNERAVINDNIHNIHNIDKIDKKNNIDNVLGWIYH